MHVRKREVVKNLILLLKGIKCDSLKRAVKTAYTEKERHNTRAFAERKDWRKNSLNLHYQ
jgi:hypothetical protein